MLQYYVKPHKHSIFENNQLPQLLYITNTEGMQDYFPRMMHKHDDHLEIVFIEKGNGNHIINGTKYDTQEGDILIFNRGIIHDEMAQLNSDMVVYCCGIGNLHIKGMEENCLFDISAPAVIPSGQYKEDINLLFNMMFRHVKQHKDEAIERCHYLLCALINIIASLPREPIKSLFYKKLTLVDQVKNYLEQHYAEPITLDFLSQRFKVSSSYLSHLFKDETKFSPIQYLNRLRIGEAQSLLMTTNQSITQIAIAVGYENITYFSLAFTKATGISPSAYRTFWIGNTEVR